ncbi:MAG: thermonuclease family protein [Cytophagales bacterium]|nr:thermonuclease family protein [Cytophagales bacterium]
MRVLVVICCFCLALRGFAQMPLRVVGVHDGDTFEVLLNGKKRACRLTNIDAPEIGQKYGTASRDSLRKAILGKVVMVDSVGVDRYKRLLVSAKVNGLRVDSLMIRKGWAWHYINYSNDALLGSYMIMAINEGLGLWTCGMSGVCPPWLFRHYNKRNKLIYCNGCVTN